MPQTQLPTSSQAFDNDNRTDGTPDYYVKTRNMCWHWEGNMLCLIWLFKTRRGRQDNWLPIWRMNGAGPSDSKIPVILCYGYFSNRFGMDYGIDGEKHSLARFLANRGRDVWIIELQQALPESSRSFIEYMEEIEAPWRSWYMDYLSTTDETTYTNYDNYFQAQDVCSFQTPVVSTDDRFTTTVDDAIFEDVPAIISAILHTTNQSKVQWVGHSMGATIIYGFMPTQLTTTGKTNAGFLEGTGWQHLPPDSILSLTAVAAPTGFYDIPQWLLNLKATGQLEQAYTKRGKLPRYFNYISQQGPKWPVKIKGIMGTALLKHLSLAVDTQEFAFFNPTPKAQQYYYQLYDGATLPYAWPEWVQFWVYGHSVSTPVTAIYDGKGFDPFATVTNIKPLYDKLSGYKIMKPFYQFSPAETSHSEMINGYVVENGIPGWSTHLNYDFGGTYHFIWYDLNRYLPPTPFSAYQTDPITSAAPLISWQNNRDAVEYELWAKQEPGSFTRKVPAVNAVLSAIACTGLSSGVWKIKVRAISLGGAWLDHSGASSTGEADDPSKFLEVTIT